MRRMLIITAFLMPMLTVAGAMRLRACGGQDCTNTTDANMGASPSAVCVGGGTTHTITVSARDLDGMKEIEISGNGVSKTCTYNPPTTEWKTCATTWSSVGKAAGVYSFTAAITDACDNFYATNCTVSVMGGDITSNCPSQCATIRIHLWNPAGSSPTYPFYAQSVSGATYNWTITSGADKAHIDGDNTRPSVNVMADAAGDGTLRCRYTKSGVNCYAYKNFVSQQPSQGNSTRAPGALTRPHNGPLVWDMQRLVTYTIKDQNSSAICEATWDETPSGAVGPGCGTINNNDDGVTGADGKLDNQWQADRFFWSQGSVWDGASNICSWTQTIKVNGFTAGGNFWTNAIQFTQAPNISVTPQ